MASIFVSHNEIINISTFGIIRGTIIAKAKKRTHKIFIKSGYQPVAGSHRATPLLSVLQISFILNQILYSF